MSRHLRAKNCAQGTIDSYLADVRHLLTFLGDDAELETVTRRQITDFLASNLNAGLALATVARRHRSLQQLDRWLAEEGEIEVNPMSGMERLPGPVPRPAVLTDGEMKALLKAWREREATGDRQLHFATCDGATVGLSFDVDAEVLAYAAL
jgi:site-specific recombinase XerD